MRTNYKRITNLIKANFECQIEKARTKGVVAVFDEGLDTEQRVRVVLVDDDDYKNEIGQHLRRLENSGEALEYHLRDAFESCFRSGFQTIWIHQQPKPSKEWRELRLKQAQDWIKSFETRVESRHTLNKVQVDPDKTLESMTQDQLELLVLCIAAASNKGHSESREWWSKAYHELKNKNRGA